LGIADLRFGIWDLGFGIWDWFACLTRLGYDKRMTAQSFQLASLLLILLSCLSSYGEDISQVAVVDDERINEASGLAASYLYPGCAWVHNDSGDKPRLFLIDADGKTKAVVKVDDADNVDWEDMCSFKTGDQSWLLIGDIGDNGRKRGDRGGKNPQCRLYLLHEPVIPDTKKTPSIEAKQTIRITFEYDDGPADCEGIAVDTERQEILLLTKSLPQKCGLYSMPLDLEDSKQKRTASRIARPFIPFATALDISPDGRTMAIGSMLNGMLVRRQPDESWSQAFNHVGTAVHLPPRKQGETICFDVTGQSLFLNSEGKRQPLWRVEIPTP